MKNNIFIAIIAAFLAVAIIGENFTIYNKVKGSPVEPEAETPNTEDEKVAELKLDTVRSEGVALSFMKLSDSSVPEATAATNNFLSKTITATVLPADAPDKSVDWSVEWAPGAGRANSNVSEYVTVVPNSDGSNVATVYCHKAFTGDYIHIKVTTRIGGYTATARCQYVGYPDAFNIDKTGYSIITDSKWLTKIVEVDCGNTYYFDLDLSNALGAIDPSFGNYKITMTTHGGITTTQKNYDKNGTLTGTLAGEVELTVADLWDSDGYVYCYYPQNGGLHIALNCSIKNGQLVVQALHAASAYSWQTGSQAGSAKCDFSGYIDGKEPYTAVTVTDMISGLSTTINIRTTTTVTGVTVNNGNDIVF